MTNNRVRWVAIISIAVLAVFELIGLLAQPMQGYDSSYHIFWVGQWHSLWQQHIFLPRWLPDSFNGLGAPTFYFYGPFTYVISSVLYALFAGLGTVGIIKLLVVLTLLASGVTMWLYLRWRGVERTTALLASAIFCVAPYRYFDYAVRSAISEHVAFIFIPLVFWGIELLFSVTRKDRTNGFFLLALSFALLLVTNIAASVTTLLAIIVYGAVRKERPAILLTVAALFMGGLLAAFQLLPMAAYMNDIHLGSLWIAPSVIESSPFTSIFLGRGYTTNVFNVLGFVSVALLLYATWQKRREQFSAVVLATLALIGVLYLPYISRAVFNFVPILKIIQRPERLGILILLLFTVWWASEERQNIKQWSLAVLGVWTIGVGVLVITWGIGFHLHTFGPPPIGDAREYTPRWSHSGEVGYSNTYEGLDNINVWTTSGNTKVVSVIQTSYESNIAYESGQAERLTLRRHYWPTWIASVDDKPARVESDSLGRISVPVPSGLHRLQLRFEDGAISSWGEWISAMTLLTLAISYIVLRRRTTASRSLRAQ